MCVEFPENDPSTTIVEKVAMTPKLQKAFEDAGYDVKDNDDDSVLPE